MKKELQKLEMVVNKECAEPIKITDGNYHSIELNVDTAEILKKWLELGIEELTQEDGLKAEKEQ